MEKKEKKSKGKLKVTYVKSVIGFSKDQVKVIEALGFKKLNTSKVFPDNESIRGSIFKPKSTYVGESIPNNGNGDITNDKKNKKRNRITR